MTLITDLIDAEIIEHHDTTVLQLKLSDENLNGEKLLNILYYFFESKVITRPKNGGFFFIINSLENYDSQAIKGDTISYVKFLHILLKYDIITATIFKKLINFPLPGNKNTYLGALYLSLELNTFYKNFTSEKQQAFMTLLGGKDDFGRDGMLDHRKKNALQKAIDAGEMQTYLDFFKYCFCCEFIDISEYRTKQKLLLKKIKATLNNLCYEGFTIKSISADESEFNGEPTYHNAVLKLLIDTGAQKHEFQYTFSKSEKDNPDIENTQLLENVLVSTNKIIADFTCSYRFTSLTSTLNNQIFPGSRKTYAICRADDVNKQLFEFRELHDRFLYARPSHLFYRSPLSYTHIEYAIYHFQKCGLLSHLNDNQLNEIKKEIYAHTYENIGDLLVVFPNTIAIVNQDLHAGEKPYLNFLSALNSISHGVLYFSEVKDETPETFDYETEAKFKVSFKCDNERHEIDCTLSHKNFDYGIIYYIVNEIIKRKYKDYNFTQMIGATYGLDYFLFMTNRQSKYLHKMKLRTAIDRF